ncbi:hypothetical protein BH10ACI2_BH10ACI2_23690 [soil metagenome]
MRNKLISASFITLALFFSLCTFVAAQKAGEKEIANDQPLKLLTKPRPIYTTEARDNHVEGTVKLEITFNADATIGEVICVNEDNKETERLKQYGLVDASINAAKKITFEPEVKNGNPVKTVSVTTYSFAIY